MRVLGMLVPIGGGETIPLVAEVMTIGRRSSCDIRLDFHNVSGLHCELSYKNGVWSIRDMGSTNGIKVNGERTKSRMLRPGTEIGIAGHSYTIQYTPPEGTNLDEMADAEENVFGQSLMEKAGLAKPSKRAES